MPSLAGSLPIVVSLSVAALGGFLLERANVPLAWLLGALFAVAAMGLSGLPTRVPTLFRRFGQAIVGVAVGLYVTPEVAVELLGLAPTMVGAALVSMAGSVVISRWVVLRTGIDGTTAYFASLPGGVAEMSVLAQHRGGEPSLVALAQSLRVVAVVTLLPPAMLLLGTVGDLPPLEPTQPVHLPALGGMIGAAILLALGMGRLRITNPWLLGGLLVGITTAVAELPLSGVPTPVVNLGQVLIGAALGAQFRRDTLRGMGRFLPAVLVSTLALIGFCLLLAALLQPLTGLGFATLALALAPGGITEMSLTAKLLQLAVPAVTAFQFVRIFVVLLSSAPLYRLIEPLIDPRPPADRA